MSTNIAYEYLIKHQELYFPGFFEKEETRNGYLLELISKVNNYLRDKLKRSLNDHQLNALICLIIDIGINNFERLDLVKYINQNRIPEFTIEWRRAVWFAHKNRVSEIQKRTQELEMFNHA